MASDNAEGLSIMKEFGPPPEIMQEVMKEQIKNLGQKIENEQDAQKLQILKQRVEEDETVKAELEAKNPEIFKKIDDRGMILSQGMNEATVRAQIEKAKAELAEARNEFPSADQEMIKMSPASRLLEISPKQLSEAEEALAVGQIGKAFGQATAALHQANSVRKIVKEVDLRKEIGQKRQEEFRQKYEQMNSQEGQGGPGGPNPQGRQTGQPGESGGQRTMPPQDFGNIDMMKCSMPQKPQCPGPVSMKKDENGCPLIFCLDAPNQNQSNVSPQQYQSQEGQMPRDTNQMPQSTTEQFQPKQPGSSPFPNHPTPEMKQQIIQQMNQATPAERMESGVMSQPIQSAPPSTQEFKPPTQESTSSFAPPVGEINFAAPIAPPLIQESPAAGPTQILFEKLGAGIIMFWDGFTEIIK